MLRMFETSDHACLYARYRPDPPAALITHVLQFVRRAVPLGKAVDVGCGTGQNTRLLAPHFTSVLGTDVSQAQVSVAAAANPTGSVRYQAAPAEEIPAEDSSVHLVTASMCYHFFDGPRFLAEADRVLVPGGVIALYGYRDPYALLEDGSVWTEFDNIIDNARDVLLKEHWRLKVGHLEEINKDATQHVGYPEATWDEESFFIDRPLSVELTLGEASTWSAFQNMVASCGAGRGEALLEEVRKQLLGVIAEGERKGINLAAATERRQCFLMLARKPAVATVSEQ